MIKKLMSAIDEKPIAYYPIFVEVLGSINAAVFISQLLYWYNIMGGRFYKTDKEIMDETLLTPGQLRTAKKTLKSKKFCKITKEGVPCKTYYDFNIDSMVKEVKKLRKKYLLKQQYQFCEINKTSIVKTTELVLRKQQDKFSEKCLTLKENTTESTTEKEELCKVETLHLEKPPENKGSVFQKETGNNLNGKQKKNIEPAPPILDDPSKEKLWKHLNKNNKKYFEDIVKIIDRFRKITGKEKTSYHNVGHVKNILRWLPRGFTLEDFEKVFQYKFNEFSTNPEQKKYINISTMCRLEKFETNLELANEIAEKLEKPRKEWKHPKELMPIMERYRQGYENTLNHLYTTWPNIWDEIRPFSMDEFTRLFFHKSPAEKSGYHAFHMRKEKFKPWLNGLLTRLNAKKWERDKYLEKGKSSIISIINYEFSQLDK